MTVDHALASNITRDDAGPAMPGEQDVARYDVRRLRPKLPWKILLVGIALCATLAVPILLAPRAPAAAYLLLLGLFVFLIVLPIVVWVVGFRAAGVLFLTNRRLLYVEKGAGLVSRRHYVASVDLAWVNSVQALTQDGWRVLFGIKLWRSKQTYYLRVDTRAFTPIAIGAVSAKGKGALFEPDQGSLQSVQELGARIRQLAVELPPAARAS